MRALVVLVMLAACDSGEPERETACRELEATWALDEIPTNPTDGGCEAPPPADVSSAAKLAVAVYHFNVQYVAGGLRGFPDGTIVEKFDLDETEVEDRIVRQGLEPVLDLFLAHPRFKADVELQSYTVELIARRHPDVLEKMRTLALRGQIDFDSFHYSDQLYVAYPKRDLEVSLDLTERIFARTCLPLGRSIFTQEGQFAVGQLPMAAARDYRVSVLPRNLFKYQFGEEPSRASVLYSDPNVPGHTVIIGGEGFNRDGFSLVWTFMDDGEIAFSKANLNPYFGLDYAVDPDLIAEHIAQLESLEAAGYVHATIAEAVAAMRARGIEPAPLPPVLDGTWQPKDTNNVFRWMGGSGLFRNTEKDSDLLASTWRARTLVERAERRFEAPTAAIARGLEAAWREVLLAEVSDSTGWNPFVNEVRYSETHAAEAERVISEVMTCAGVALAPRAEVACQRQGTLEELGAEVISPARQVDITIERCGEFAAASLKRLTVAVSKVIEADQLFDESEAASLERELEVRFAREGDRFSMVRALEDRTVELSLDDYAFEDIGVPLAAGAISLGGDRWLVQELGSGRVAAILTRTGEERRWVRFRDLTVSRANASERRYWILEAATAETARAFAYRINGPT